MKIITAVLGYQRSWILEPIENVCDFLLTTNGNSTLTATVSEIRRLI